MVGQPVATLKTSTPNRQEKKSPKAMAIGADAYCRDAAVAVETAKEMIAKKRATASSKAA